MEEMKVVATKRNGFFLAHLAETPVSHCLLLPISFPTRKPCPSNPEVTANALLTYPVIVLKPQTTPPPKITLSTSSPSEDWCESLPAPLQFDYFTSHGAPSTDPQILHDPLYYHPSSPTASIPALTKRWQSLGDEARSLNDEIQHLETRNSSTSTLPIPDPEPSPPPTPTPSSPPSPGDSYLPTPPDSSVPELPQAAIDLLTSLPPILLRSKEVDERIAELKKERDELRACWREIQKIHQLREEQRERIDLMEAKLAENIRAARDEKKGF
jgi:hypothetical protein